MVCDGMDSVFGPVVFKNTHNSQTILRLQLV